MKLNFYSPVHFEKWDWRNSVENGIGGSETCHVELCWRMAQRGHEVISYAPLPDDCPGGWRETRWLKLEDADFTTAGIWFIFRDANCIDKIPKTDDQAVWLVCQDESPIGITPERAKKIDIVVALCPAHMQSLTERYPEIAGKIKISSNGLKMDLIREVETEACERNKKRLMYASSPDRGLLTLLKVFSRAREYDPELELHCFYGTNNIEKLIEYNKQFSYFKGFLDDLKTLLDQPNVFWRGRVSQKQLYQEWMKTGLWVYPTHFTETSCITCMEAQALGAIPITRPLWALESNVKFGTFIEGDPSVDKLSRAKYVGEILRWTSTDLQDRVRPMMMNTCRATFNWERIVDQLEAWIYHWEDRFYFNQFNFQLKHSKGRILNVGCADDPANFGTGDNINLDIATEVPMTRKKIKAHILHDAREPLPFQAQFDTVILGDILEHMTDPDAVKILRNITSVLKSDGRIVITCPEDYRPVDEQHSQKDLKYLEGESAYHERPITEDIIMGWLKETGLKAEIVQAIDYTNFTGRGIVATHSGRAS